MGSQTFSAKQRKGSVWAVEIVKYQKKSRTELGWEKDQIRIDKKGSDKEERSQCQKGGFDEPIEEKA